MTTTKKGWNESLAMSFFTKEASYDAGVSMTAANACSLYGYELDTAWEDKVVTDKDAVPKTSTVIGSNLVASWINAAHPNDYDTFTSVGSPDIAAAVLLGATQGICNSASIVLAVGRRYKLTPVPTITTGVPILTGTGGVPTTTLTASMTPIEFIATAAATVLTVTVAAGVCNWSCTFTLYLMQEYEHGNDQELIGYGVKFTYKETRCKPNTLAGLAALVLGSVSASQDPGKIAYVQKILPVTTGTALPSIQVDDELSGGLHYAYKGVKGASLKLSGEEGGLLALEASLLGSGTRALSNVAFPAVITESWMLLSGCKVWMETGTDISITSGAMTQAAENISSDTPDSLYARMKSFEWMWDNALAGQEGFGGGGVLQDADCGRRKSTLKLTMRFYDGTELAYFTAQNPVAIEFDLKGALIATGGTMYFGMSLTIPRMKLKAPPLPKGGPNDTLMADYEFEIFEDGTNKACRIDVYSAQAAYLA